MVFYLETLIGIESLMRIYKAKIFRNKQYLISCLKLLIITKTINIKLLKFIEPSSRQKNKELSISIEFKKNKQGKNKLKISNRKARISKRRVILFYKNNTIQRKRASLVNINLYSTLAKKKSKILHKKDNYLRIYLNPLRSQNQLLQINRHLKKTNNSL